MVTVAGSVVSDEEVVDELRAAWAEVSRGYARCWAAMAEVARHTTSGWESAEISAALTFTTRRADYELGCARTLVDRLPRVHAAVAAGELDHHKARVFTDYLGDVTPAQAERICRRLVPVAPGWTTGQLAARLLREVQAIDPDYTRRTYQHAVRQRGVHGYLDHNGTAVLTGSGLPAAEAAAAAARLEALADELRAAGYPATVNQTRADLYLRLLDGTLDGLTQPQILTTMLRMGPLTPADTDPDAEPSQQPTRDQRDHQPPQPEAPEQPAPAKEPASPAPAKEPDEPDHAPQPSTGCPYETRTSRPARYGVEVRVRLSTLLGLDDHPAELPGWGPLPAAAARDLVAAQHRAEWRIAIVDTNGYLLHGDLTRRRPTRPSTRDDHGDRTGGIVEIAIPVTELGQLPGTGGPGATGTTRPVRYGVEVRVRLSTLLGLDNHPAELPGWGPLPAAAARNLVAAQHRAEWRVAIVDTEGYLLHGGLTRRRPTRPSTRDDHGDRTGGIVEIAIPVTMLDQFPALAAMHPDWARVLHGITGSWNHRAQARAALDQHPHRRFAHAALRRHVQMRDRHCVGVGCRRRAAATDLDHTRDHARGGATVTTNSGPQCERHHTMKHQAGWTLQQPKAGHFLWTSPLKQTYRTRGEPITPDLPQPLPRDDDPDPPGIPLMFEGPILWLPEPSPPPARPPPVELPDEPPF